MTSTTRSRYGQFSSTSNINQEQIRPSHGPLVGSGFGSGGGSIGGTIWGPNAIGSGLRGNADAARAQDDKGTTMDRNEGVSGSAALLGSSDLVGWNGRSSIWNSSGSKSPGTNTSPMRRQKSNQSGPMQSFPETSTGPSPYFSITPASSGGQGLSSRPSQSNFLDPTSSAFVLPHHLETSSSARTSRHNSDEDKQYAPNTLTFGNPAASSATQGGRPNFYSGASGYKSGAASRSGSMPPSRDGVDTSSQYDDDLSLTPYNQHAYPSLNNHPRPNLSTHSTALSTQSGVSRIRQGDLPSPQMNNLVGDLGRLGLGRENQNPYQAASQPYSRQAQFPLGYEQRNGPNGVSDNWDGDENGYQYGIEQYSHNPGAEAILQQQAQFRGIPYSGSFAHTPSSSDARRSHHSPYYSANGTPPSGLQPRIPSRGGFQGAAHGGQAALLHNKLRGLQQEQQGYVIPQSNPLPFRQGMGPAYDLHHQHHLRMNPLSYYGGQMNVSLLPNPSIPRGPAKDHDPAHGMRSALLEEFRSNSKTNRRYELKDVFGHIVEFSGDQSASRFIQQKLETANSDEKEQVFREILENAMQLMTDVFGNYVIQKFFEHGNQSQKKRLAAQMKGHILVLSKQMYGCRVVQKAFEHILTDQQAELVRELDGKVMECVQDQNGNHVIQKAVERIPAEHIQFILLAFTGQVRTLSVHSYGCRVIQRMLEHCVDPTRTACLQELHACTSVLLTDQYGNYVTQHIIEHGGEDDRNRVIALVQAQLIHFSKHKFASNVVEKCIQFGTTQQRRQIFDSVTQPNEKGDVQLPALVRDQYGNYVVQTLLTCLDGAEYDELAEMVKPELAMLKRFSHAKQFTAIEKIIYNHDSAISQIPRNGHFSLPVDNNSALPTPPLLNGDVPTPQSASLPSTKASSVDGPLGSRKSSGNAVELVITNHP